TTTTEGQDALFEDFDDASPLLSRCLRLDLSRRDLSRPFAERAKQIAQAEGIDGLPIEKYVKLAQACRNNLRAMLQAIDAGALTACTMRGRGLFHRSFSSLSTLFSTSLEFVSDATVQVRD